MSKSQVKILATNKIESDVQVLKIMVRELAERLKALEESKVVCLTASYDLLRPSEIICLQYVAMGLSNKQIAERIGRRPSTVASTLFKASQRLGTRSRAGALAECYRRGLFVGVTDIVREVKSDVHR